MDIEHSLDPEVNLDKEEILYTEENFDTEENSAVLLQSSVFTAKLCNTEFLKNWLCFSSVKLQKWAKTLYFKVKTTTNLIQIIDSFKDKIK